MNVNEMKCTIRFNKAVGGIEIVPEGRLPEAEWRAANDIFKSNGFQFHKKNSYWYTVYSEEKMAWVRKIFKPKGLTKADEAATKAKAEERAAQKASTKKPKKEDRVAELEKKLDALMALLASQQA